MNSTSTSSRRSSLARAAGIVVVAAMLTTGSAACALDTGEEAPRATVVAFEQQDFLEALITIDGREARVTGHRTPTETRISVELPQGLTMLTQAVLRVDGKEFHTVSSMADGEVITTIFPATGLDEAVEFELGAIAKFSGEPSLLTVAMEDVLKAADGDQEFPIPDSAILAGDASRVLGGQQGSEGGKGGIRRPWVGIEVVGNWQSPDPEAPPQVLDGRGVQLQRSSVESSYRKDVNGVVSEGTSKIAAFVTDDSDLSQLTFVLSPSTVPDGQTYSVRLQPE